MNIEMQNYYNSTCQQNEHEKCGPWSLETLLLARMALGDNYRKKN